MGQSTREDSRRMVSTLLWSLLCLSYIVSGQNKTNTEDSNSQKKKRHLLEFLGLLAAFGFKEPPHEDANKGERTDLDTAIAAAFKKLDKNNDGALSRDEKNEDAQWDLLKSNNLNLTGFKKAIKTLLKNEFKQISGNKRLIQWDEFDKLTNNVPLREGDKKRWFDKIEKINTRDGVELPELWKAKIWVA